MRLKLTLFAENPERIPCNYQYPLSAAIYKLLSQSSPEYSEFLHDHGYTGPDGKPRKLFTFSGLFITPKPGTRGDCLQLRPRSTAVLLISSPMINDFVQHLVMGLFSNQVIEIGGGGARTAFAVRQVEVLPEPVFTETTRFIARSPIVVTTVTDSPKGRQTYYYRPMDGELSGAARLSLLKKHLMVYKRPPENDDLVMRIDRDYIRDRGGEKKVSRLIRLREGQPDRTDVKGFMCPFTLTGSTELMRTAWECGLGDKTSMGFGCIEAVGGRKK